jgi:hypothetical protein
MKAAKAVDQIQSWVAKVPLKNPVVINETASDITSDMQNKINETMPTAIKRQKICKDVCQSLFG